MGASQSPNSQGKHPEVGASVPVRVSPYCFVESTDSIIESDGEWENLPPLPDIATIGVVRPR